MKLRIKGNSIRLRLTQKEVADIGKGITVAEKVKFTLTDQFQYELKTWEMKIIEARFEKSKLTVFIPKEKVDGWLQSDEVGFEQEQDTGLETPLHILIEKDFACLTQRDGEDEKDNFPHPATGAAKC